MQLFKPSATVTEEDRIWIEEAFIWFEEQYGRDFLKSVEIIEPTKKYFNHSFSGKQEDAEFVLDRLCEIMQIKNAKIELYYFSDAPLEFSDEGIEITQSPTGDGYQNSYKLGQYSEHKDTFEIGIELKLLKSPNSLIATIAHELSHLMLLGEGRLAENDEELTDLNCIALGLGIFISNAIFNYQQWQGTSHQGWSMNRSGYIPEQVAAYAMAIFQNFQGNQSDWDKYLNKSVRKMYLKNLKYLDKTKDEILFKN